MENIVLKTGNIELIRGVPSTEVKRLTFFRRLNCNVTAHILLFASLKLFTPGLQLSPYYILEYIILRHTWQPFQVFFTLQHFLLSDCHVFLILPHISFLLLHFNFLLEIDTYQWQKSSSIQKGNGEVRELPQGRSAVLSSHIKLRVNILFLY